MRNGTHGAAGDRLREGERQRELWRLRRRRRGRIPTDLWLLAAEAAAEQGGEPTARELRLNSERLEPWVEEWQRTRRPVESGKGGKMRIKPNHAGRQADRMQAKPGNSAA